jgi:hypothetical protein
LSPILRSRFLAELARATVATCLCLLAAGAPARGAASQAPPTQTGTIRGIVQDTRDGTGLRNVSVRLQSTGRTVTTDDDGRFEFTDVPAGEQEVYVSAVDFLLVKRTVGVPAGATVDVTIALTEGTGTYAETVTVRGFATGARRESAVAAEQTLAGTELQQLRGVLANDPLRAVQVLPSVAAGDDFRSEFAIRGAGIRQMNFTFEGISTPFLLHTVQQVHDSGSVAMVNGDVLQEISLLSGSYPQRYGNRTGAEIDFRMRDGSRDRAQRHLSVSAIDASGVVEGPLGSAKRGSWLASARKSYLNFILDRVYPVQNVSFGFVDTQAKVVLDASVRHQLQLAFTAGRSQLERQPDKLGAGNLRDADNQSAVGVMTWRYIASPRVTLTQRVAATENGFRNRSRDGADLDSGDAHEALYRADLAFAPAGGVLLEGGAETRWSSGAGREQRLSGGRFQLREDYDSSATSASAYAQVRLAASSTGASVVPGLRVDRRSLTGATTASPWIQARWPLTHALTLRGGAGVYRQEPGFVEVLGTRGTPTLRLERAYHADLGIEGRIGAAGRWQLTMYDREDRDLLSLPASDVRVVDGGLVFGSLTSRYVNALDGYARGVEWLMQRQTPNGLSGWVSYALGFNRYRDRTTNETFWGDFDQRHTVNVYGNYRVSERLSLSARFRAGSNFPVTGYWASRDGEYFVGTERNTVRVPLYSRLDVRANRTFTWERRRLTLFLEAINVLNRSNVRFALPAIDRRTFQTTGLLETMAPLIPSAGILLEF